MSELLIKVGKYNLLSKYVVFKEKRETMKTIFCIFLFLSSIWACKDADVQLVTQEKITLSGEWRYVGKFSHNADYRCLVCPEFDYEKSIYRITFKEDGTFDARINLLIGKGNYAGKPNVKATSTNYYGEINITNLQILNKPLETEADGEFKQKFVDSNSFSQNTKAGNTFGYDELIMNLKTSNFSEYLLFVRKK